LSTAKESILEALDRRILDVDEGVAALVTVIVHVGHSNGGAMATTTPANRRRALCS
jgi:hypothetical protein